MRFRVTTPPSSEPLSLVDALKHLRLESGDDNAYVSGLITKARDWIERTQHRALWTQTITGYLDEFPEDRTIELERPPLVSVTSVTYRDANGATQTLASSNYVVDAFGEPGRIVLKSTSSWPVTIDEPNAVSIVYQAGFTAETFPAVYKHALKILVGHWFEHREPVVTGTIITQVPNALQSLLDSASWGNYR